MEPHAAPPPSDQGLAMLASRAAVSARPWLAGYAQFGFVTKGVVYLATGLLALMAALGRAGTVTDVPGVLLLLPRQPFGRVALAVMAAGLVGFGALRLFEGIVDPTRRPRTPMMGLVRLGELVTGGGHLLLAFGAFRLVLGARGLENGDESTRQATRELLAIPYGDAVLTVIAAVVLVVGVYTATRGMVQHDVCDALRLDSLSPWQCRIVAAIIRFGLVMQGTLFVGVGAFLLVAAHSHRPAAAQGPAGAIRLFAPLPYGRAVLAVFALGLVAVAASSFFDATWRRYPVTDRSPRR